MEHHHHHEHTPPTESLNGVFIVSIVLNLLFVLAEAGVGWYENSLGLLSDAGHNLGDVFSLLLALLAFRLSKMHGTKRYTYGYKKSTVLVSLLNAIILLVAVGAIVIESIRKFGDPVPVNGAAVSWTAGAGILVNGFTAWLLMRSRKNDLNVHGAFLHMAADTLVSVGVVVSGAVMAATGWFVIDPIVSLLIAAVILVSTWRLLAESLRLSLDGIPGNIDTGRIAAILEGDPRVREVHHVHIWAISTTDVALTAHLVLNRLEDMESVKREIREQLGRAGIAHATLEVESAGAHCGCADCI